MKNSAIIPEASAELALLLALLKPNRADTHISSLCTACRDWDSFLRLARYHRCVPQAHAAIASMANQDAVPSSTRNNLKMLAMKIGICNISLTQELDKIAGLLEKQGIRSACIKGPALSLLIYGNTTARQYGDLDLIVSRADLRQTIDLLLAEGYYLRELTRPANLKVYISAQHCVTMNNLDRTIYLDIACTPISHALGQPAITDAILNAATPLNTKDSPVLSPGPELMMVLVCMHGAADMWNKLMIVNDVAGLLRSHPNADWTSALLDARQWGQERSVLIGLSVASTLLQADIPACFSKELQNDHIALRLARKAVDSLLYCNPERGISIKRMLFEFKSRERTKDRIRWLLRQVFVPGARDLNRLTLPGALQFLHYALRPFRLVFRLAKHSLLYKQGD